MSSSQTHFLHGIEGRLEGTRRLRCLLRVQHRLPGTTPRKQRWDVANEMEIEDGVIWVYGIGEDGVLAFTDFGIENLIELIKIYKENPRLLRR